MTSPFTEIEDFLGGLAPHHPELRRRIQWPDVRTMAAREGVAIRSLPLSSPARLVRFGRSWEIQLNADGDPNARAFYGMHELVHFWRDREDEPTIYASDVWQQDPKEDFANAVALYCTSLAYDFYAWRQRK